MPSRKKTIENTVKMMQKEAKAQLELGIQKWNGYPIVSVQQWKKILFSENPADAAKFLPDDYTDDDIVLSFFAEKEAFHTWWKNWMDFLSSRKNPTVGRRCCTGCILNYEPGPIQRHVLGELGLSGRCDTVNAFCCPNTEFGAEYLIFVGKACQIIENVLLYSAKQAMYDSMKTFLIDHITGEVFCYDYPGDVHPTKDTIQNQLVPISERTVLSGPNDYAMALADLELFSKIFDQYCDFVENGSRYYGRRIECKEKADQIRKIKCKIISFVRKYEFGSNVLEELHQSFVEFERAERQRLEEHRKNVVAAAPEIFGPIIESKRNGLCSVCGGCANIHCTSCSVWICIKHWKEHQKLIYGINS